MGYNLYIDAFQNHVEAQAGNFHYRFWTGSGQSPGTEHTEMRLDLGASGQNAGVTAANATDGFVVTLDSNLKSEPYSASAGGVQQTLSEVAWVEMRDENDLSLGFARMEDTNENFSPVAIADGQRFTLEAGTEWYFGDPNTYADETGKVFPGMAQAILDELDDPGDWAKIAMEARLTDGTSSATPTKEYNLGAGGLIVPGEAQRDGGLVKITKDFKITFDLTGTMPSDTLTLNRIRLFASRSTANIGEVIGEKSGLNETVSNPGFVKVERLDIRP